MTKVNYPILKDGEFFLKNELKLSLSKTKTFIDCKKKFKFCYIHKLPRKEFEFHTFGKFCHKVLETFHLEYINGSDKPFNKTMSYAFKDAYEEYKLKMTPDMKKECWDLINQYLMIVSKDKHNNLSANVLACEKNFSINIAENLILNGAIDRIQLDPDDVVHVADYKTTKNKKYLKDDWFQLLTYCYVILTENPHLEKIRGSYILLRHNFEYLTKKFSREEILKVKDEYVKYANQIALEQEYKPNPTFLCNFCDFLDHCDEGKKQTGTVVLETSW